MDELGIKFVDIKGVEDLYKFFFIKKIDLWDNYFYGLFVVFEMDICCIYVFSGIMGKLIVVGYNEEDLNIFDEVVVRFLVCVGVWLGMKLYNVYGYGLFIGGLGMYGGVMKLGMVVILVLGGMMDW